MTEEEEEEALAGFPLSKRESNSLSAFAVGPAVRPKGMGIQTITKLLQREWIVRTERQQDYGPEIYVLTDDGRLALELNEIALEIGYVYEKGPRYKSTYANLPQRRALFNGDKI